MNFCEFIKIYFELKRIKKSLKITRWHGSWWREVDYVSPHDGLCERHVGHMCLCVYVFTSVISALISINGFSLTH